MTARSSSSSTCCPRCVPRRMAAAASPSSSTAPRSSPATPAAARVKFAAGSLRTTGWRPSLPFLNSSSTTPASPPTSGCSLTEKKSRASARCNSSMPASSGCRWRKASATNAAASATHNTGISTYLWVLTNRKQEPRKGKVQLIDARQFWVQMEKSLGNKRRRIGDPSDEKTKKDPDHIGELTKIYGNRKDGETRIFTEEDPITHQPIMRERVVSKIFDKEDFGYHKITVERPLRLNFQASSERIALLDHVSGFKNLATSAKKNPKVREKEIEAGRQRQ